MSKSLVRLIGGENAGKEVWHDPDEQGPILRMILHPDFNMCPTCAPDKQGPVMRRILHPDFNVCPTCAPDEPIDPDKLVMHYEKYLIHKINFDTGHFHYYAAPPRLRLVDLMNCMWDGYKIEADMERRNGH